MGRRHLEPIQQPRPGKQPIPFDGRNGNAQDFSGLGFHQAAKKPKFDDAARSGIGSGQVRQRLIDRQNVNRLRVLEVRHVQELHAHLGARTLARVPGSRVIHEDPAHLLSHRGQEMGPIVPFQLIRAEQPEVRFVHQGRRLQCVTATLAAKILRRATAKLRVQQGHELLERAALALPDPRQHRLQLGTPCPPFWEPRLSIAGAGFAKSVYVPWFTSLVHAQA